MAGTIDVEQVDHIGIRVSDPYRACLPASDAPANTAPDWQRTQR